MAIQDMKWVPVNIKVDRRNPEEGIFTHLITCSEDGQCIIWDTRTMTKEVRQTTKNWEIEPCFKIQLFRVDGTGEMGMNRMLFHPKQEDPIFYACSDEGDLMQIDWSVKPPGGDNKKKKEEVHPEYILQCLQSERNYRPTLDFQRSPFFDDVLLTIHDYHFAIWKTSLSGYEEPIFRSSPTIGSTNTCGCFSPTRPGVIFIGKSNGIDVWDFIDQSHKASMSLANISSPITFISFQECKQEDGSQVLAFGERNDGIIFIYRVPPNLKKQQGDEKKVIEEFWDREINKCLYQKDRKDIRITEREEEEKRKAIEEAKMADMIVKIDDNAKEEEEMAEEAIYQALLMDVKKDFELITEQEYNDWKEEQKKNR